MLAGKVLKDFPVVVAEMVIALLLAYSFGYRTSGSGLVVDMLLVFLTAVSFSSLSYLVEIFTRQEDALSSVLNAVLLPLILLSGILIPDRCWTPLAEGLTTRTMTADNNIRAEVSRPRDFLKFGRFFIDY